MVDNSHSIKSFKMTKFESMFLIGLASILLSVPFGLSQNSGDKQSFTEHSMRIINGARTKAGQYPHMAFVELTRIINYKKMKSHCGGTLITSQYVLTAAHCVYSNETKIRVYLGDLDWSHYQDGLHPQILDVVDVVIHPEFYATRILAFDMALLKLNQSVVFNEFVDAACLPMTRGFDHIHSAIASGWGRNLQTDLKAAADTHLHHATVPIRTNRDCCESFKNAIWMRFNGTIPKEKFNEVDAVYLDCYYGRIQQTICAGSDTKGSCFGDSGGPLQIVNVDVSRTCKYEVIGVVSYGTDGRCTGYTRYENVGAHIDWIAKVLGLPKHVFQRKWLPRYREY